jgi:hypothetical protein
MSAMYSLPGVEKVTDANGFELLSPCDPEYRLILADLKKHELPHYETAVQTIVGLGLLEKHLDKLPSDHLTESVRRVSGFCIHAAENYPSTLVFQNVVQVVTQSLKSLYHSEKRPHEQKRFFSCALSYNGCFEGRAEQIMDYEKRLNSTLGILRSEIQLLQESTGSAEPVALSDLIAFLGKNDISLESLHIDPAKIEDHPAVLRLIAAGYIMPKLSLMDRISSAAGEYFMDPHPTLEGFKKFLHDQIVPGEPAAIDLLVDQYLTEHPEAARFLAPGAAASSCSAAPRLP